MIIGDYSAVLDACVLHPVHVRGALLWMAEEGLFRPLWSSLILDEWERSLLRLKHDIDPAKASVLRHVLLAEFEEALVDIPSQFLTLTKGLLPDPNDDHVLAAAICGKADAIITANLKDFPKSVVSEYGIEVRHPDDFMIDMISLNGQRAVAALQNHRASLTKSSMDVSIYIDKFKACAMPQTHIGLQDYANVL